jgi:4-carboxymuconolactone decarboxylase
MKKILPFLMACMFVTPMGSFPAIAKAAPAAQKKIVQTAGRDRLGSFAPLFAEANDDFLFGKVWNDPSVDVKTRCIITITSLVSMGVTDSSLKYHLQNAKNHGVTKEEIAGILTQVGFYAGWPKAWAAFNLAKEVWPDTAAAAPQK